VAASGLSVSIAPDAPGAQYSLGLMYKIVRPKVIDGEHPFLMTPAFLFFFSLNESLIVFFSRFRIAPGCFTVENVKLDEAAAMSAVGSFSMTFSGLVVGVLASMF
jgi:hypothetical protein